MKRAFPKVGIVLIMPIVAIAACFTILGVFGAFTRVAQDDVGTTNISSQQTILTEFTTNLKDDGVPVTSAEIKTDSKWDPPNVLTCIIQSSSLDEQVSPDDPIYLNLTGHEANLANQQGLNIGAIETVLINTNGKIIDDVFHAVNTSDEITPGFNQPSSMTNDAVNSSLENAPLDGLTINSINVSPTEDGQHRTTFNLQDPDVTAANVDCVNVVNNISTFITNLNQNQGSHIAIYEIRVVDGNGNPLFNYIRDLQFGRTTWWHSDTIGNLDLP